MHDDLISEERTWYILVHCRHYVVQYFISEIIQAKESSKITLGASKLSMPRKQEASIHVCIRIHSSLYCIYIYTSMICTSNFNIYPVHLQQVKFELLYNGCIYISNQHVSFFQYN